MPRHLYIAGTDHWPPANDVLSIEQALTYQIDTCSFHVAGMQPSEGDEVIIEDDAIGRLFAGIIVKVELVDKDLKIWSVEADDYTALLDRRLVVEAYENMSASDIFVDIAAKYCPGFTVNGVRSGAPMVESTGAEFDYKPVSECFRWLCDYVGWHWQPDYYKDLQFFSAEELASPAPLVLTPGGPFRFGKHTIDIQGLRNRVYVRGGTMLTDPQELQWKADGVARTWTLPWPPHEVSLAVGEAPMTVGVENLHEEADYEYMMSYSEKYIRCSSQTATPVEGITMSLTAKQDIPVITMYEDYASQTAIAAVQGGDGIYEHVIDDESLTTIQAAEAAGMADLREHANPKVSGSFETEFVPDLSGVSQEIGNATTAFPGGSSVGQSFVATPGLAATDKIKVSVRSGGIFLGSPEVHFHIFSDANGLPGDVISTSGYGVVDLGSWPADEIWFSREIELDERLQKGQTYWLVVAAQEPNVAFHWAMLKHTTNDPYALGERALYDPATGWAIQPNTDLVFKIEVSTSLPRAWQPGQLVEIDLPDRGVEGTYLIQKVTMAPVAGMWTYQIQYGGRLFGIADFLKALVSAQQKKRNVEPTQSIQKYVYGAETIQMADELVTTTRELPFVCGDPDAICGMVVVSDG